MTAGQLLTVMAHPLCLTPPLSSKHWGESGWEGRRKKGRVGECVHVCMRVHEFFFFFFLVYKFLTRGDFNVIKVDEI